MIQRSGIQRARAFAVLMASALTFMIEKKTPQLGSASLTVGGVISAVLFGVGLLILRSDMKTFRGALRLKSGFMMVGFSWLIAALTTAMVVPLVWAGAPAIFAGCGLAAIGFAVQLTTLYLQIRRGTPSRKDAPDQL
ncbi:MAG: hypothetical protein KF784_11950 [Fimbriimonadaceae bacterium]|nr:hypothetical protein [Fimbriimonadaceae bacterium]